MSGIIQGIVLTVCIPFGIAFLLLVFYETVRILGLELHRGKLKRWHCGVLSVLLFALGGVLTWTLTVEETRAMDPAALEWILLPTISSAQEEITDPGLREAVVAEWKDWKQYEAGDLPKPRFEERWGAVLDDLQRYGEENEGDDSLPLLPTVFVTANDDREDIAPAQLRIQDGVELLAVFFFSNLEKEPPQIDIRYLDTTAVAPVEEQRLSFPAMDRQLLAFLWPLNGVARRLLEESRSGEFLILTGGGPR